MLVRTRSISEQCTGCERPVFSIDDFVNGPSLKAFEAGYVVTRKRAYPSRMLLKLWLFGGTEGVYSGREIARPLR
jgi:hypothetical protein